MQSNTNRMNRGMSDDQQEQQFQRETDEFNQTLEGSMQLSLKDHLDKLEVVVKGMLTDLETSKREIIGCKQGFIDFDAKYHNSNKDFAGMIEKRMTLLNEDFNRLIKESRSDLAFLRNQLDQSLDEAQTLEDLSAELEKKIKANEEFIGHWSVPEDNQVTLSKREGQARGRQGDDGFN